jgi:hydrogenase maturation protease
VRIAVVGIGNPQRGDDAAGLAVIDRLAADPPAGDVTLIRAGGDLLSLPGRLQGFDAAILVDAMVGGAKPGRVRRFDASALGGTDLPHFTSTHSIDLPTALVLAGTLGEAPRLMRLFGIEAVGFTTGAALDPRLEAGIAEACNRVRAECLAMPGSLP